MYYKNQTNCKFQAKKHNNIQRYKQFNLDNNIIIKLTTPDCLNIFQTMYEGLEY